MDPHDRRIIHSSAESGYRTPPRLFRMLDQEFSFEFDAAADPDSALSEVWAGPGAPSEGYQDGLDPDVEWWRCGVTWLNPPYSVRDYKKLRQEGRPATDPLVRATLIEQWVRRAALEGRQTIVVAIIPASIQTEWWQEYIWTGKRRATEVRLIPHRVSFLDAQGKPTGSAGVNHAIVIWKPTSGIVGAWAPQVRYWTYREEKD